MSMDPESGRLRAGRRACRGQEDPRGGGAALHAGWRRPRSDARPGRIVMPGFRRHAPTTCSRTVVAAQLSRQRDPDQRRPPKYAQAATPTYFEFILLTFRRPSTARRTLYINQLVRLVEPARRRAVTNRARTSRRSHHSPAAISRCRDPGHTWIRNAAPCSAYFESAGGRDHRQQPRATSTRTTRVRHQEAVVSRRPTSSCTMIMGGEVYLPGYEKAWKIGRDLGLHGGGPHPVSVQHPPDAGFAGAEQGAVTAARWASGPTTCSCTMTGMSDLGLAEGEGLSARRCRWRCRSR